MARLVLSDASPLIGLDRVDGVTWLRDLFGRLEITPAVARELSAGPDPGPTLADALEQAWLSVREGAAPPAGTQPSHLGAGEWSTIVAAREHPGPCLVLLDDRLARREARAAGVAVAGTAAIIGMAQVRGLIPSAREVFERLLQTDFRISPQIIREVLAKVGA